MIHHRQRLSFLLEASDDLALLHKVIDDVAPRARRIVSELLARGGEEGIPPPAELRPAREAATKAQALETLRKLLAGIARE